MSQRSEAREFRRAYKACLTCRKRKSRCEVSVKDYAAGQPCARCRRELKECVFPGPRTTPRRSGALSKQQSVRYDMELPNSVCLTTRTSKTPEASFAGDQRTNSQHDNDLGSLTGASKEQNRRIFASLSTADGRHHVVDETNGTRHRGASLGHHSGVAESVIRTVVSSGNDALNLLFVAAREQNTGHQDSTQQTSLDSFTPQSNITLNTSSGSFNQNRLPNPTSDVLDVWNACRFVKMGWFSAEEAVYYVDKFFEKISPLSPILPDFFRSHGNHYHLVTQEPMLCCVILTISSRYNNLPGIGGNTRGYLIHERLWSHCQHIIMRIVLGQEKSSKARTRTFGTIEALLLLTEWHPRALHFPPPNDGWDSDLMMTAPDQRDEHLHDAEPPSRGRWLEDVINPATRSDRMTWMMIGCAMSLAHELGVFDKPDAEDQQRISDRVQKERRAELAFRLQKLLFLYAEQASLRLGCKSIVPPSLSHAVSSMPTNPIMSTLNSPSSWGHLTSGWVELTKLMKVMADVLFPSHTITKDLLASGRYVDLIHHFQPLLSSWKEKHLLHRNFGENFNDILFIEYQNARIYANSLGIQAVVERTLADSSSPDGDGRGAHAKLETVDYGFIQEVVDGSLEILQRTTILAESQALMFSPVRIFLRVTTASVFLLKGLSLGVQASKLRRSIDVLTSGIAALRSSALDDVHLGSRYATLLEVHVDRLKSNFVPSSRPPAFATRPSSLDRETHVRDDSNGIAQNLDISTMGTDSGNGNMEGAGMDQIEDWLTLPFDPSLVPYVPNDSQAFSWLGDGSMDFIWNLPIE